MTTFMENRWARRAVLATMLALAVTLTLFTGTALADPGGVEFDPTPEEIPGMDGMSTLINWTAWGAAIIDGIAFIATNGWLDVSEFTDQEIRECKGNVI